MVWIAPGGNRPRLGRSFFFGPSTMHMPESTLVFIVGRPASGTMTVGHELAQRTGLKLFHNYQTIDLILPLFPFGTPAFHRLVGEFRRRLFEEVAASDLSGLIFTYVWAPLCRVSARHLSLKNY